MKKSCLFQFLFFIALVFVVTMFLRGYIDDSQMLQEGLVDDDTVGQEKAVGSVSILSQEKQRRSVGTRLTGIEGLARLPVSALMIDAPRIRGLAVSERFFYVSSFDPDRYEAYLYKVNRENHSVVQVRTLREEGRYQLGGLYLVDNILLVPLAGDEADAGSSLLFIDTYHLEIQRKIEVGDRIRAVAQGTDDLIYGVSFGSNVFYVWTPAGEEIRKKTIFEPIEYSDMEIVQGSLVCSGVDSHSGIIDIIDPYTFTLLVRHRCYTRTPDQQWVTSKGFALFDGVFYFVPNEGHFPMLMRYVLDGVTASEYIPSVRQKDLEGETQ